MECRQEITENYKVYMHITPNNKKYIGITGLTLKERWSNGKGYRTQLFQRAIDKYGWENIEHKVLYENLSKEEAIEKEIELIEKYDCTNPKKGYNLTKGGDGANGIKLSEETKRKISESHKGKNAVWYGKKLPEHTKKQISIKIKALWKDEVYRKNQIEKLTGRKLSEKQRNNMSKAHRKLWEDEKYREKCFENFARPHQDDEIKERRIASIKEAYKNPELRNYFSELYTGEGNPFYGRTHTEETKKKLAEYSTGKCGKLHPRSKPTLQYDLEGNFIKRYESANLAAIENGIDIRF